MSHTIIGRAQPTGLVFDPSQLATIGIRPGSTAWGVFVDSARLDELADLSAPAKTNDNQSVHIVLSAIHPDRWPTCFRLQVFLEKKRGALDKHGSQSVVYGLFDALARCGVNVLDTSKALMGYDAVSLTALCEFPKLRSDALKLIKECDKKAREFAPIRPAKSISSEFEEKRKKLQTEREKAFRNIGRRLIHHLAVLQARLMLSDELRYWRDRSTAFADALDRPSSGSALTAMLGRYRHGDASDDNAMSAPWFVNRHILDLSENPFYLGPSSRDQQHVEEHDAKLWDSVVDDSSFTGCEPTVATAIFDELLGHLRDHEHRSRHLGPADRTRRPPPCESSFWSRCSRLTSGRELRSHMIKGVIQRAFAFPILVSPVPTLSYARVWALPHKVVIGPNDPAMYYREIEFEYDGKRLSPRVFRRERVQTGDIKSDGVSDSSPRELMKALYTTINRWSRLKLDPLPTANSYPEGENDNYTFRARAVAALNLSERFLRIRLVRATTVARWGTIIVTFKAEDDKDFDRKDVSSIGLLAVFTQLLAKLQFRVEDIYFHYERIDVNAERGTLSLVVQSALASNPLDDPYELGESLKRNANGMLPKPIACENVEVQVGMPEAS